MLVPRSRAYQKGVRGRLALADQLIDFIHDHEFPSIPFKKHYHICLQCPTHGDGFWTSSSKEFDARVADLNPVWYFSCASQAEAEAFFLGANLSWPKSLKWSYGCPVQSRRPYKYMYVHAIICAPTGVSLVCTYVQKHATTPPILMTHTYTCTYILSIIFLNFRSVQDAEVAEVCRCACSEFAFPVSWFQSQPTIDRRGGKRTMGQECSEILHWG